MNPYPENRIILSYSVHSMVRSCDRKFEFAFMYGEPPEMRESSFAADVGTAIHRGAQEWLLSRNENKAVMAMLTAYPFEQEYERPENANRSIEACYSTLQAIINHRIMNEYDLTYIKTKNGLKPCIEVPFAIQIIGAPTELELWFTGYIDAWLHDYQEKHYAWDVKTTREWLNDFQPKYEFDEQTIPYGLVLEHALGNAIEEFETHYLIANVDILDPKIAHCKFTKRSEDIADWLRGLCITFKRIIDNVNRGWFPRVTDGSKCMAYKQACTWNPYCSYRDPTVIAKLLGAKPRLNLMRGGEEPWIVAQIPWVE